MDQDYQRQARTKLLVAVAAIVIVAGLVLVIDHLKAESAESAPTTSQSTSVANSSTTASGTTSTNNADNTSSTAGSGSYKDGTYTASSEYYVPHGYENIDVSLTLKSGVVTGVSVTNSESDHDSARYQEDFAAAYKNYVVGKSIGGLRLNVISGASDTTQGFNDALDKIASQAQA